MTGRTFFCFYGIIAVGLFESATLGIMAVETEARFCFCQEIVLVGTVRQVACLATLVQQCLMDDLLLKRLFLMALVTGFVSRRVK